MSGRPCRRVGTRVRDPRGSFAAEWLKKAWHPQNRRFPVFEPAALDLEDPKDNRASADQSQECVSWSVYREPAFIGRLLSSVVMGLTPDNPVFCDLARNQCCVYDPRILVIPGRAA